MPDYGCSRLERFELEKNKLNPLNAVPYEFFEWKKAKVHPDCCIELQRSVYSVPSQYLHKTVLVKYSDQLVIILDETSSKTLTTHPRQPKFKNSIRPEHLPPHKAQLQSFDIRRVQKFADQIGEKTREYVDWQMEREDYPLRSLRRLMGLMRFSETKNLSPEALEYVATQAKTFARKDLRYFQNCAINFQSNGARLQLVTPPYREMTNIHIRTE